MSLLRKLVLALSLSTAMMSVAPTAMAGKIAHQTAAEAVQAIDDTLEQAELALEAIKAGGDVKSVLAVLKTTKQFTKTIESATTYSTREKALGKLSKARRYYKKGDQEKALVEMEKALVLYKKIKTMYHDFM